MRWPLSPLAGTWRGDDTQTDPAPPRDRRVPDHRPWRAEPPIPNGVRGMSLRAGDGQTAITGPVVDRAHLHGLLDRVRDLGHEIVSGTAPRVTLPRIRVEPTQTVGMSWTPNITCCGWTRRAVLQRRGRDVRLAVDEKPTAAREHVGRRGNGSGSIGRLTTPAGRDEQEFAAHSSRAPPGICEVGGPVHPSMLGA
jgi:hypothetical protein